MLWILLLSLLGIADAGYLTYKARRNEVPVCPIGQSCRFVLQSTYNQVFGIKNEVLGLFFYIAVAVAAIGTMFGRIAIPGMFWTLGLAGAFVASLILTGIQVVVLRAYCSWCLASAAINALLFATGIVASW